MKKNYFLIAILLITICHSPVFAQPGTVTVTPTTGLLLSGPFKSITEAYAAIPIGPTTPYIIELTPGYNASAETFPIVLGNKNNFGSNTITIQPSFTNTSGETILGPSTGGTVIQINGGINIIIDGRPGGSSQFNFTPASWLAIKDSVTADNNGRCIELLNGADTNIIRYTVDSAGFSTGVTGGAVVISIAGGIASNDRNLIFNNVIKGGLIGIRDQGENALVLNSDNTINKNNVTNFGAIGILGGDFQKNISIINNTISAVRFDAKQPDPPLPAVPTYTGIENRGEVAVTIQQNTINLSITSPSVLSIKGIVDSARSSTIRTEKIFRNNILGLNAPSAVFVAGISIEGSAGPNVKYDVSANKVQSVSSQADPNASPTINGISLAPNGFSTINVYNNFVAIDTANEAISRVSGIISQNTGNPYIANVDFNSVRIGGTLTGGIAAGLGAVGINRQDINPGSSYSQRSNISIMERPNFLGFVGISNVASNIESLAGIAVNINCNNYYGLEDSIPNSNAYAARFSGTNYNNKQLIPYQTAIAPQETGTTFAPVTFASSTDLHLSGPSTKNDPNLQGCGVGGISDDIDGDIRGGSSFSPTKGADEIPEFVPITLLAFTGETKDNYNKLNWVTASELNTKGFELQHSSNGINFTTIGTINSKAVNGTSSTNLNYSYNDLLPFSGTTYYRLKEIGLDGFAVYSNIILLRNKAITKFLISNSYPNPVQNELNIVIGSAVKGKVYITINDIAGKKILSQSYDVIKGNNLITIPTNSLSLGSYLLSATINAETLNMKFVK